MPVIVIGADTALGRAVVAGFDPQRREVRAFVSDPTAGETLKARGYKVAIGDVSDGSHVGGASRRAFSAVLIAEAATDGRERAFAGTAAEVAKAWAEGLAEAGVSRIIWVEPGSNTPAPEPLRAACDEVAVVGSRNEASVVADVVKLDEAAELP